jgi:microsomal epoxide hydrolase
MTSSKPFGTVPAGAKQQPTPFELHVEEQKLQDLKTLLKLSPVAKETYENLKDDGSHGQLGVSRKWVVDAKKYWEEDFDWYVSDILHFTTSDWIARIASMHHNKASNRPNIH